MATLDSGHKSSRSENILRIERGFDAAHQFRVFPVRSPYVDDSYSTGAGKIEWRLGHCVKRHIQERRQRFGRALRWIPRPAPSAEAQNRAGPGKFAKSVQGIARRSAPTRSCWISAGNPGSISSLKTVAAGLIRLKSWENSRRYPRAFRPQFFQIGDSSRRRIVARIEPDRPSNDAGPARHLQIL